MTDQSSRTLGWLAGIFSTANKDTELEFETKFCDQFQGLVPEEASDFQVGVNSSRFFQIIKHFEAMPDKFKKTTEKETMRYMNRSAVNMYADSLMGTEASFHKYHPSNIRIIHRDDRPTSIICKTRFPSLPGGEQSVLPEGFKMTLSREAILTEEECVSVSSAFNTLPEGIFTRRNKDRVSFTQFLLDGDKNSIPVLRIDMTTTATVSVSSDIEDGLDSDSEIKHEIELEYIGNKNVEGGTQSLQQAPNLLAQTAKLFFENIQTLLCLIHRSNVPLNLKQHNAVVRNYLSIVRESDPYVEMGSNRPVPKDMFVGCQPESLHERHLQSLVKEPYFISGKTNGDRYQLLAIPVNPTPPAPPPAVASKTVSTEPYRMRCYIIDRWMHVKNVGLRISIPRDAAAMLEDPIQDGFLIDGEVVVNTDGKSETYWPFDVLSIGNSDLRPKLTNKRLEKLRVIVDVVQKFGIQISNRLIPMDMKLKDFIFWPRGAVNAGDLVKLLQVKPDMPIDGLIFMRDEPHPRKKQWPGLLKCKGTQSTVDLFVRLNESAKRWEFYASGNFATIKQDGTRCLVLKKIASESRELIFWVVLASGAIVKQHSRDLEWSESRSPILFPFCPFLPKVGNIGNLGEVQLEDKCVFEFYYDEKKQTLVPLLKRVDKSFLGIEGANDLRVAVDVWESMKYPVTKEQLLSLSVASLPAYQHAVNRDDYPHVGDFHKSYDWALLFSGRTPCDAKVKPTEREMQSMRLLHNRIKLKTIESIRMKRSVTATDIMRANGGILASSRDHREQRNNQEWCLPRTAMCVLTTTLGINEADIRVTKERVYVNEHVLQGASVVQPRNRLIVVDLCSGKFGDMAKYYKNDVAGLIGVDNEPSLVVGLKDSALNRWADFRSHNQHMDSCFVLADCRQPLMKTFVQRGIGVEADVVGCFFALHYFFSSERDARSFFQNVKDLLKPDGVFIGTMIDGELMLDKIREHDGIYHHRVSPATPPLFTVTPINFDHTLQPPRYGAHIDVQLQSTILEQYATAKTADAPSDLKQENLVNFNDVIDLASEYDLELVQTETFNQFFPEFPDIVLTPEMAAYSSTHRSFKFRKLSRSALGGTTTFHQSLQNIQRLQFQQLETKKVANDMLMEFAADDAFPKSSMVKAIPWESIVQTDKNPDDEAPPEKVVQAEVEFEIPESEKKREREPEEVKLDEPKKVAAPPKKAKADDEESKGCSTKCLRGNCKACCCKRKYKSKCTDQCGCGPNCINR